MADVSPTGPSAAPTPGPQPARPQDWVLVCLAALAVGVAAAEAGMPAGLVFGSTVGAATVAIGSGRTWNVRSEPRVGLMLAVGVMAGVSINGDVLAQLPIFAVGATLTTGLLVVTAVAVTVVSRRLGRPTPNGVLATLPGALEALTAVASHQRLRAAELAWFHTVRVLVVVISIPLLLRIGG